MKTNTQPICYTQHLHRWIPRSGIYQKHTSIDVHAYAGAHKWIHMGQIRIDLYTHFQPSMNR